MGEPVSLDGVRRFAFIHGNGSLDDSEGPVMCGVRTELRVLRDLGVFVKLFCTT
jgi:hypothetical protein